MTDKEFHSEKMYQISRSVAKTMLKKNIITPAEYASLDNRMLSKYRPALSSMLAGKSLT